jgi:NCAIR mutase (PurE)-related protein
VERKATRELLQAVREGTLGVDEALERLRVPEFTDLGFAKLDLHRAVRRGFPEVVYGPGKTAEEIALVVRTLRDAGQMAVVTRVGADVFDAVRRRVPEAVHHERARIVSAGEPDGPRRTGIVVVSAGTADRPVAEEAIVTAELMGHEVARVFDVGVAGLHRLLAHRDTLLGARVVVVVAGMEGALPSVVAGMIDCPIIGVPTSAGYGIGRPGEAALLAMLHSCAGGLTVVNVDNGFGAGYAAALINRLTESKE